MKCIRCGGNSFSSTTNEVIDTKRGTLTIKNIPCYKCEKCGETYYTGDIAEQIETMESIFLSTDHPDGGAQSVGNCHDSYADGEFVIQK
ncbi:MAG: YgiT-type zinc finger protein [Lachnospiraceae bacterium]|nr:YgiT-type zinc finger protein [Lachnospiraceae bacterium]